MQRISILFQGDPVMKKPSKTHWSLMNFLTIFLLILSVSGCSGSGLESTEVNAPLNVGVDESVITFGSYEYQRPLFEPLIETFQEQNPGIKIQFVDLAQAFPVEEEWNEYMYLRHLAQAADTVLLQGFYNKDMSRYFRDLRPIYEADLSFNANDFWPGILSVCEDPYGNIFGLPMTTVPYGVFYDEAAFDAAGVSYPQPGWTWEDFQRTITALADKTGSQIKYGFYDQPSLFGSILSPIVADHLKLHYGEVDADAFITELQWYIDLARNKTISGIKTEEEMTTDWEERDRLFKDDALRPAMWVDSLISSVPLESTEYDPNNPLSGMSIDRFGFAPYPVDESNLSTQLSMSGAECASVSAGSKNPRAAWAWVNFLSNHWLVMDKTQVYELSRIPVRRSVADSSGYWDLLPEKATTALRYILEHGSYGFYYIDQLNLVNIALAKTISEGADFEQELANIIEGTPPTPTPPAEDDPIVVATPRPPLPEGATAIRYFFSPYGPNELNTVKALAEQFNQNFPEIYIDVATEFYGNPGEDWTGSIASNFDCFTTNPPNMEETDTSPFLNLNSFMSKEPSTFTNDFSTVLIDKFSKEGNLIALPASSQVQVMAYNADLLAQKGVEFPDIDWTFEDFINLASMVASNSESDPSYGFMYSSYDEFINRGIGVEWANFSKNPPEVRLDSPEMIEHLEWLASMENENVFLDQEKDWENSNGSIVLGRVAFWTTMMGDEEGWFSGQSEDQKFKIGIVPFPEPAGDLPLNTWSNDRGHYISAQSENPQVCWDWFKFLSEQPNLFVGVPARLSVAESPAWEAMVGKEKAEVYRAALAKLELIEMFNEEMQQILWPLNNWRYQAVRAALDGKDIKPVLVNSQQEVQAYLACALALDTSVPFDQFNEEILSCLRKADPDGMW